MLSLMRAATICDRSVGVRWWCRCELALNLLVSLGIYFGRFQRFNSWDMVSKPEKLALAAIDDFTRRYPLEAMTATFGVLDRAVLCDEDRGSRTDWIRRAVRTRRAVSESYLPRRFGSAAGADAYRPWPFCLPRARSLPATSASSSLATAFRDWATGQRVRPAPCRPCQPTRFGESHSAW